MLNETAGNDPAFRCGVEALPLVRRLDPGRLCFLDSGRWDNNYTIGSLSNPGSASWESDLRDVHGYPPVPHGAGLLRSMRTSTTPDGLWNRGGPARTPRRAAPPLVRFRVRPVRRDGSAADPAALRAVGQIAGRRRPLLSPPNGQVPGRLASWQLDRIWARPEDFFSESHANFARLRQIGENALRANPHLVAFNSTYPIAESGFCGSGTSNTFRELKPGLLDAAWELAAPLRWCLFVEPVNVYRHARVKLEAVLANEDVLRPGKYPVRLQVVGPAARPVWEKTITVEVPDCRGHREPPFACPVFAEEIPVDGRSGKYRFLATFLHGGAATGGQTEFHVTDPADMPPVAGEIALWGDDPELHGWLLRQGIRVRQFGATTQTARETILVSGKPPAPGGVAAFTALARRIARGSTAVFLDPRTLGDGRTPRAGSRSDERACWRRSIGWAATTAPTPGPRTIPSLPACRAAGCSIRWSIARSRRSTPCSAATRSAGPLRKRRSRPSLDEPAEAVCGANRLSANYASGLHVAVYRPGCGPLPVQQPARCARISAACRSPIASCGTCCSGPGRRPASPWRSCRRISPLNSSDRLHALAVWCPNLPGIRGHRCGAEYSACRWAPRRRSWSPCRPEGFRSCSRRKPIKCVNLGRAYHWDTIQPNYVT